MTSTDHASSAKALERADQYIQSPPGSKETTKTTHDRMLINKGQSPKVGVSKGPVDGGMARENGGVVTEEDSSQSGFLRSLEEDAKERGERRREMELRGKEAKKKGNKAFKEGDYESAVKYFTEGIKEAPWDITLYTNRALVSFSKAATF